jgi:hypothetical protein
MKFWDRIESLRRDAQSGNAHALVEWVDMLRVWDGHEAPDARGCMMNALRDLRAKSSDKVAGLLGDWDTDSAGDKIFVVWVVYAGQVVCDAHYMAKLRERDMCVVEAFPASVKVDVRSGTESDFAAATRARMLT